jgi:thiamine-phosphate pyrophosphorylase
MSFSMPEGQGPLRRERLRTARLYFVCDARPPGGDLEAMLRAALGGGVDIVQLREKEGGRAEIERAADTYRRVADTFSVLFIVNDEPDLARACDADGVHLGEVEEVAAARELLGADAIVGVSTHSPEQIAAANEAAVDYIAVGPIWETPTKPGRPAVGLELIGHAAEHSRHPFFAIGGVSPLNAEDVVRAGARRLCVVRAIREAPHPEVAAAALRRAFAAAAERNGQDELLDSPAAGRGVAPGG